MMISRSADILEILINKYTALQKFGNALEVGFWTILAWILFNLW